MSEFNTLKPIGSIYEKSFEKLGSYTSKQESEKLVEFVCYCVNPNHFHFLLKQLNTDGIKKFMHRIGTGYTKYFNNKYKRSGNLFQRPFKSVHIDSNEYLLHLSAYINLNGRVHKLGSDTSKFSMSSWEEFIGNKNCFCEKSIILGQFNNILEYKNFTENSLNDILERREIKGILLE